MRYIEISAGHYVRSDVIAGIQFKRATGGGLMASIVTTVPSPQGTVHYDVYDADAIEQLEALIIDGPKPHPRMAAS